MPLPGGAADKVGNRYERSWTISRLVEILLGNGEELRIEDPTATKSEFVVSGSHRELHQAKRAHTSGKWSLSALGAELLRAMYTQLAGNDATFVFVSGSDAPDLRELSERARSALTFAEFESHFLDSKSLRNSFKALRSYWEDPLPAAAFDVLRRIYVRIQDERAIRDSVERGLRVLFLADPEPLVSALNDLVDNSVHERLSREAILRPLEERGFRARALTGLPSAQALVAQTTERLRVGVRHRLIEGTLIRRDETQRLLEHVLQDPGGSELVVTGRAGSGKSAVICELVEALSSRDVPTLAFRLDRLEPTADPIGIGRQLGLEESPALVLAASAGDRGAVLIIDQLDAISATSGRSADFLDGIRSLLDDVRMLRKRHKLHVVLACRAFDWDNDQRLRQILLSSHSHVEVGDLSLDEVTAVLKTAGFDPASFRARQLALLQLPQNLSLFVEGSPDNATSTQFLSVTELFSRYWDTKRSAVRARAGSDQWADVIRLLCDEMTATQHLFVLREGLDHFDAAYLEAMASEGVITFDGKRYGFGHESFFDYCFARTFVTRERSLTALLREGEQHLFRRAQVRQVISYLRDADRARYLSELEALIADQGIRPHIKDLAIAWLMSLDDPADDEWQLLRPHLDTALVAIDEGGAGVDRVSSLIFRRFWASRSWFQLADRVGFVADWMTAPHPRRLDALARYLSLQQRHASERVAQILDSKVGAGADWQLRLRHIVEWSDLVDSRRFLELVLRLVDDGTLDDARGPIATNSTFWSLLYGPSKERPDWTSEVAAHWLRRRMLLAARSGEGNGAARPNVFGNDEFASEPVSRAAGGAPVVFARNVTPLILELSDGAFTGRQSSPPHRDRIWYDLPADGYRTISMAFLEGCATALAAVAADHPELARQHIVELSGKVSYTGNYLLVRLYTGGCAHFADEAVETLCAQPWRLECGRAGARHAISAALVAKIAPACTAENRERLQSLLRGYLPAYEKTADGRAVRGLASFELLSAIPPELLNTASSARLAELGRKFGKVPAPPLRGEAGFVRSPISEQAASRMSDDQWLGAFARYNTDEREWSWTDPLKGGAYQLSEVLRLRAAAEPERFARLLTRLPAEINPAYVSRVLAALQGESVSVEVKLEACREASRRWSLECGAELADLIGTIAERLPDDVFDSLTWLAEKHPDPSSDPVPGSDGLFGSGIGTVRGRAALAARSVLFQTGDPRLISLAERLVNDPSAAVRSCVASTLVAVAGRDLPRAIRLLDRLIDTDDRILIVDDVQRLINYGLAEHFTELRPFVERMLRSSVDDLANGGARLASLAALYDKDANDLVDEAANGNQHQRLGVAQVASANVGIEVCSAWCVTQMRRFFHDPVPDVRREAASGFRQLSSTPLEPFETLILEFCDSPAFGDDSASLIYTLDETKELLPGTACAVAERFIDRFAAEARDITTSRVADAYTLVPLIFRVYHQHQRDAWAARSLDVIDRVCLEGLQERDAQFDKYER